MATRKHHRSPTGGSRSSFYWSFVLLSLAVVGCGGSNEPTYGTVSGIIYFEGVPIPEGVLYAYNPQTAEGNEGVIKEGEFEFLTELKTGSYTVFVTAIPPPPPGDEPPAGGLWGKFPTDIPEKYQRADQSDLKIEVGEGHNDVTLDFP